MMGSFQFKIHVNFKFFVFCLGSLSLKSLGHTFKSLDSMFAEVSELASRSSAPVAPSSISWNMPEGAGEEKNEVHGNLLGALKNTASNTCFRKRLFSLRWKNA